MLFVFSFFSFQILIKIGSTADHESDWHPHTVVDMFGTQSVNNAKKRMHYAHRHVISLSRRIKDFCNKYLILPIDAPLYWEEQCGK